MTKDCDAEHQSDAAVGEAISLFPGSIANVCNCESSPTADSDFFIVIIVLMVTFCSLAFLAIGVA